LEGRSAPGLYLVAWLLSVGGVALLFVVAGAPPSPGIGLLAAAALLAICLGLAAATGYQIVARADRHPSLYRGPSPLIVLGIVLCASALVAGPISLVYPLTSTQPIPFLITLLISNLVFLAAIWLFAVRSGALTWRDMGWPAGPPTPLPGPRASVVQAVIVSAAVMVPATFAVSLVAGVVATILDVEAPEVLPDMTSSSETLIVAIAAAVVAPIGEEAFFRGFALTAWLRDLGPRAALIRSALLFGFVHIANITATSFGQGLAQALLQFTAIVPLGLLLGWLFLRYGMAGAIVGHMTYNGLLLVLLLLAQGSAIRT
jgi:membrane protease YdiL (CAAX protease family)